MKLKEVALSLSWDGVKERFLELYEDQTENIEGYEYVFVQICTVESVPFDMVLYCDLATHETDPFIDEGEEWFNVYGRDGSYCEFAPEHLETFGLSFTPWDQWSDMEVDEGSRKKLSDTDIICHCLWEMTFYGFDQEKICEQLDELNERVQEAKDYPERLIPAEEVFKRIKDKLGNFDLEES